ASLNAAYSYNVAASDSDNDALAISASHIPAWMTLHDNGNGTATLSGTPGFGDVGADASVTLIASDGTATAQQTFTVALATPPGGLSGDGTLIVNGSYADDNMQIWIR